MAMQGCKNGHWFDTTKHKTCPSCISIPTPDEKIDPPVDNTDNIGRTIPVPINGSEDSTETTADSSVKKDQGTTPTAVSRRSRIRGSKSGPFINSDKTVPVIYTEVDKSLPVGFMICISGEYKGNFYKLHSDNNTIGRDTDSRKHDINISNDNNISRESNVTVNYNPGTNEFSLSGGNGDRSEIIVKRNNKPVMPNTSVVLSAYDKILIGKTKFIFLPLCGEAFVWED
jgi:hypothetical protein